MSRVLAAVLALLVLLPVGSASASTITPPPPEHRADPSLTTYVKRLGPYTIGPYETLQKASIAKPPAVAGAIVAMDARLVDKAGNVIPQQLTMLHHLVFTNGGPDNQRGDPACPGKSTRERFWGTSEELRPLTLPPGYGYPTNPADQWRAFLMVMHHRAGERQFYVEYRVTVDTRPTIAGQALLAEHRPVLTRSPMDRSRHRHQDAEPRPHVHDPRGRPDRRRRRPPARRLAGDHAQPAPLPEPHAHPQRPRLRTRRRPALPGPPAPARAGSEEHQLVAVRDRLGDQEGRTAHRHRRLRQHPPAHAGDGDRAHLRRARRSIRRPAPAAHPLPRTPNRSARRSRAPA